MAQARADGCRDGPSREYAPFCSAGPGDGQGRGGGGAREELHGDAPEDAPPPPSPPPKEPGTQYFTLTPQDWCVPVLGGMRPAPVLEARPQEGTRRHGGIGYELVLATAVPQLGALEAERALPAFLERMEEEEAAEMERMKKINDKILARIPVSAAEMAAWRQWQLAGAPSQPSSPGSKRRKKRKRRKKKVPNTHSSSHFLQGSKAVTEYSGRDGPAPGVEEGNKLIEKKVIAGDILEDIFHKNGLPALTLYSDPTHLYISPSGKCWLTWMKNRRSYVRRKGCAPEWTDLLLTLADGQICNEERVEQTLSTKTVKDVIWLLCDVPPAFEFLLGRANAVADASTECFSLGTEASMMTMRVWVMMTKLQRRHRRSRSWENGEC